MRIELHEYDVNEDGMASGGLAQVVEKLRIYQPNARPLKLWLEDGSEVTLPRQFDTLGRGISFRRETPVESSGYVQTETVVQAVLIPWGHIAAIDA